MFGQKKDWETRENAFAAFSMGPLTDFWRQREEAEFKGVDDVPVRFVRFCAQNNDRLVLICPGRIESYVKYAEVAYDLFHSGFDVMIIDHRGRGARAACSLIPTADTSLTSATMSMTWRRSGSSRWSPDTGENGLSSLTLWAGRLPRFFCNVTRRIVMRLRSARRCSGLSFDCRTGWCAIFSTGLRGHQRIREEYAIGTGRWRALPFAVNVLTHSRQRYRRNLRFYADEPRLQVGGPTWHWVREGMLAGDEVLANVEKDTAPTLLLQAQEERVVDNLMHDRYCELRAAAGHPCEGGKPLVIEGAYHEILFEKDAMRSVALNAIVEFFNRHT